MRIRTVLALAVLACSWSGAALAQSTCTPACHPNETLRGDGYCEYDTGFPTYARSHRANDCAPGAPVDMSTGICTPQGGCGGGGGGHGGICSERPVCAAGETFRDDGCYPPCNTPGACDHTRAICEEGWTLDRTRGVCRNCRIHVLPGPRPFLRPDLVFRTGPAITPPRPGSKVPNGRPYSICFTVANTGGMASGAFRVGGAGLGVLVGPSRDFASLAAGAMASGCLVYPMTPSPGHYSVELTIDSAGAVTETREDNNTGNVVVNVVP